MTTEERLPGGFVAEVVRVGDTVRRTPPAGVELIHALHDVCAGTDLASDAETICHRDLSPKNTVYRDSPAGPLPAAGAVNGVRGWRAWVLAPSAAASPPCRRAGGHGPRPPTATGRPHPAGATSPAS
ncbi:hypothetical protein [Micromonospora sp. DT47]|uniref:hypothetical protein n=1 Tax=Micromonospora sp. DT47 TaxID=3393431 RepID=UPI003CF1CD71